MLPMIVTECSGVWNTSGSRVLVAKGSWILSRKSEILVALEL